MKPRLKITNETEDLARIDIEGTIGFEPWWTDDKIVRTKEKMKSQLKELAAIDATHIVVDINSYGGDVNHGVSIHDLLANHPAKVTTNVYGHTASAATIIAQAGDERTISANALYLVHQGQTLAAGTADDMDQAGKMLTKVNRQIAEIYAKRSGRTVDEMISVMDRNNGTGEWLTADEAMELGFVDEIVEPFAVAASADPAQVHAAGLPPIPDTITETQTNQKDQNQMFNLFKTKKDVVNALENLDAAVEAKAEEIRAEFLARIDALQTERDELTAKVETLENEKNQAETAVTTAQAENAELTDKVKDAQETAEKLTAQVQPKASQNDDTDETDSAKKRFQAEIAKKMDDGASNYVDAAVECQREFPELHKEMIEEANK